MVGAGLSPLTATDSQLSGYADDYFEYDDQFRATEEIKQGAGCSSCSNGFGTYTYAYTTSAFGTDENAWAVQTAETLPDGNTNTVYTNGYGQVMLTAYTDVTTGQVWRTFHEFDSAGRLVLTAQPSAVTGADDSFADLLHGTAGNYQYLSDSSGLVMTQTFGTSTTATATTAGDFTGRLKAVAIQQGETGTAVPQQALDYLKRTANSVDFAFQADSTVYRNTDGTGGETTSASYTWQGSTARPDQVTITLPAVTTAENGPGTADTSTTVYDGYGRPVWTKDGAGFINYTEYDLATGAVTKQILDVDTTQTGDFNNLPSGWNTPTGGGLHLKTLFEVEPLGRTTKTTYPNGRVDYTVYTDTNYEVRSYLGWDSTNNVPTGPTMVMRVDRAHSYSETLTMSATPTVNGGRPTGAEAIASVQTLSREQFSAAGQRVDHDAYFNLTGVTYSTSATLGTEGANYYRTQFGFDDRGRPDRTQVPTGTIYRIVYDGLDRVVSAWMGTNDTPASGEWSPTNNTAPSNMVDVRDEQYDSGGVGDGNQTLVTEHPGGGAADRQTQTWFDWRDRAVAQKQGVQASEASDVNRPIVFSDYDNLNEVTQTRRYDGDGVAITITGGVPQAPSASLLRAETVTSFDEQGRIYRTQVSSVDPVTGSVSTNALATDTWFDRRGLTIETAQPGGLVLKTSHDGADRVTVTYTTDGGGDSAWSDAFTVTGDAVLQQVEYQYDGNGNLLLTATRQRFHDETTTGALGNPTTAPKARVSYSASYYDLADRPTATVNVGTNGGVAWARPASVPARSDTVLVTSQTYAAAGWVQDVTDPKGLVDHTDHDNLGRVTKTVQDYTDGTPTNSSNKTVEYGYDGMDHQTSLTALLVGGGSEQTQWVFGVTGTISSNDLLKEVDYPDPTTGVASSSQRDQYTYNVLGQQVTLTDRNGTIHTYTYDVLGRQTADAVTTLGTGVDGSVRRLETAYDSQGNPYLFTSYDAASGGNILNQVQQAYNGLRQLTKEYQSHSGAVNTSTTPNVQYAYAEMAGGANNSRLVSMTYPNGRVLNYNYASGLDSSISRLTSISDSSATLESYSYLGLNTVVVRGHPQPGVDLTYVKLTGESNGDAGDEYVGLDRFGRVVDQRWVVTATGTTTDRFQYGYDRDSNRLWRDNLVNSAFGELYTYDGLNQLTSFQRGTLNSTKDGLTGSASHSQSWSFDALGNWTSVTTDGAAQTRTANKQNEITSVSGATTPGYDANGNTMIDEQGHTLIYDPWHRLVQVKSGSTIVSAYGYDALNRRVTENESGTAHDLYDSSAWQILEERVSGQAVAQYVWGLVYVDALVERDRDTNGDGTLDERLYAQQDANWNVTALVVSSGTVAERFVYDPYGQSSGLGATWSAMADGYAWVYRHQGGRLDATAGLYDFRGRVYSPTLGRWLQNDPVSYTAGDPDLYRYINNRPVVGIDPLGTQPPIVPPKLGAGSQTGPPVAPPTGSDPTGRIGIVGISGLGEFNLWTLGIPAGLPIPLSCFDFQIRITDIHIGSVIIPVFPQTVWTLGPSDPALQKLDNLLFNLQKLNGLGIGIKVSGVCIKPCYCKKIGSISPKTTHVESVIVLPIISLISSLSSQIVIVTLNYNVTVNGYWGICLCCQPNSPGAKGRNRAP